MILKFYTKHENTRRRNVVPKKLACPRMPLAAIGTLPDLSVEVLKVAVPD